MLVWRKADHPAPPPWFKGARHQQTAQIAGGNLHWIEKTPGPPAVSTDDEDWTDLGDGWHVTQVGPFDPRRYERQNLDWGLVIPIVDGRGAVWKVPAMLRPDGLPAVDMAPKWVDGDYVREPVSEDQAAALSAAQAVRQHIDIKGNDTLEEVPLARQMDWLIAILLPVFCLSPSTIVRLPLTTDILRRNAFYAVNGFVNLTPAVDDEAA